MSRRISITLDFDGRDVRLLVVKGRQVRTWATLTVPRELMHQGLINEPREMAKILARFMAKQDVGRSKVITSVTGYRSVTRIFRLPDVKPNLLDETVRRKAKQEMPLPIDETYLSWELVNAENNHMRVFALAVPRIIIDRQVETLKLARLRPRVMDLRPLSLARCIYQENSIIINLEEQNLGVIVVEGGMPIIIRNVPRAGDQQDVRKIVERLPRELLRTIQFYNDNYREEALDPKSTVFATGAAFSNPEIANHVASNISHKLTWPKPPLTYPPDFPITTYSANVGLALKEG
jgi:type IV pilus assembly protein PilM